MGNEIGENFVMSMKLMSFHVRIIDFTHQLLKFPYIKRLIRTDWENGNVRFKRIHGGERND